MDRMRAKVKTGTGALYSLEKLSASQPTTYFPTIFRDVLSIPVDVNNSERNTY